MTQDYENYSEALAQLSAMLSLWGYTKRSPTVQAYLKSKGVNAVADLNHAQIKALACMLEISWQRLPAPIRAERMRCQELLIALKLTPQDPSLTAWLKRHGVEFGSLTQPQLVALNQALQSEFENVQAAKNRRWEEQYYGFSLTP